MYGKRKLTSILSKEINRPYQDVLAYGKYMAYGRSEKLILGGYRLCTVPEGLMLEYPTWPDDEEIVYKQKLLERRTYDDK